MRKSETSILNTMIRRNEKMYIDTLWLAAVLACGTPRISINCANANVPSTPTQHLSRNPTAHSFVLTNTTNYCRLCSVLVLIPGGDPLSPHSRRHPANLDEHVSRRESEHREDDAESPSPAGEDEASEECVGDADDEATNKHDGGSVAYEGPVEGGTVGDGDASVFREFAGKSRCVEGAVGGCQY